MPQAKPRMLLTLPEPVHQALRELSNATGMPATTFVVAMLEEALPSILQLVEAAKQAKESPQRSLETFQSILKEERRRSHKLDAEIGAIGKGAATDGDD